MKSMHTTLHQEEQMDAKYREKLKASLTSKVPYRTVTISVDAILGASRILTSCPNDDDNNAYNMFSLAQDPQHAAQCGLCFVGQEIIDLPL